MVFKLVFYVADVELESGFKIYGLLLEVFAFADFNFEGLEVVLDVFFELLSFLGVLFVLEFVFEGFFFSLKLLVGFDEFFVFFYHEGD